jgi:hypothetical protein
MAAALVLTPAQVAKNHPVVISGTGFAFTTAYTITISNPDETESVTESGTTDGAGAFTSAGNFTFQPEHEGVWTVKIVCGADTLTVTTQVFTD